ncbi:hypothetical protein ACLOJK_021675 [Asimina triloba]
MRSQKNQSMDVIYAYRPVYVLLNTNITLTIVQRPREDDCGRNQDIYLDGGGARKGILGKPGIEGMFAMEGMVGIAGMEGMLGILVGMAGNGGSVVGNVGNVGMGRFGSAGMGGNVVGKVGGFGNVGMVGNGGTGDAVCRRCRAARHFSCPRAMKMSAKEKKKRQAFEAIVEDMGRGCMRGL